MTSCDEIKQTVERILNLTADHINVGDGKLCFNIIGIVSSGDTHLTHVRIGGTGQQQRFRTLAGGTLNPSKFKDGDTVWIEPFRAKAFPILRDLMVDRSALDRIIAAGGYIDVRTGSAPNANNIAVEKVKADAAFDAAACIGCGACVASCKNASAMLFTSAKIAHLNLLPQGQPERSKRVLAMMKQMEAEGFGNCTNQYECEAACPKGISVDNIARLNRDFMRANAKEGLCF